MPPKVRRNANSRALSPYTLEGLQPQRVGLLVRAINVTRRAGFVSSAAAMHHHRVVPHGKTVCQVERFARADSGRD